jgi:hypothetical protein
MSTELGFVVVEFNQVGGSPQLRGEDIWDEEDARDLKEQCEDETRRYGRGERFAIAKVTVEDAA